MDVMSAVVTLFLVMDPLGNVPLFLSVLKTVRPERRRIVLMREILFAYFILITFLLAGGSLLDFLGLQPEAVGIAGGIVLFLIALRMIFPSHGTLTEDPLEGEPFVVPWRFRCSPGHRRWPPCCCSKAPRRPPCSASFWP